MRERTRIANMIGGLLRLHGISVEAQELPGFRERVDELMTGCGTPLPPELRAVVSGLLDRPTRHCTILDVFRDHCSAASSNRTFVGRRSAAPGE